MNIINLPLSILLLFVYSMVAGQDYYDITYDTIYVEGYETIAVHVSMMADKDDAKSAWNDFIQDEKDVDIKGYGLFQKKDQLYTELTNFDDLASTPVALYAKFMGTDRNVDMRLYLRESNTDTTLRSEPKLYGNLADMAHEYVAYFLPEYYDNKVEATQEEYNDIQKNIEDLNQDIVDRKNKINELKIKINELDEELRQKDSELYQIIDELEKRKVTYEAVDQQVRDLKESDNETP